MSQKYDFGLIGLGVMGRNFILNVLDKGFSASGMDLDQEKSKALQEEAAGMNVFSTTDLGEFTNSLSVPRKIMLLVPAGAPVDSVIKDLEPLLDKGDLIIDGGNSFYEDTDRREKELEKKGIHFIGAGVSGGAKGARFGPSIMPGGKKEAYDLIRPVFESVSAKVDKSPCVDYMGSGSAGNYVKMVHNGIEYGLMQLISEIYDIMKRGVDLSNRAIGYTFTDWTEGKLQSFLVEITSEIFQKKDEITKNSLVDMILDKARQKGTGRWTSQNAMDLGVPIPAIDAAVSMRQLSGLKTLRVKAADIYSNKESNTTEIELGDLENALYFGFLITYAQGMSQLTTASSEYNYGLNMESIARIWRGGCIIRAALLEDLREIYESNNNLPNLLLDDQFAAKLNNCALSARKVVQFAVGKEIPVMSLSACLAYFDAFKSERLPSNLIQAQRDHFGSHTYERIDKEGIFHSEW